MKQPLALLLAALTVAPALADPPPIRVGVIMQMSGPLAAYGQETWEAFRYTIDKINAEGGIKKMGGAKIELVLADDASLPARAANEARRLITDEHVDLLAGGLQTPEMLAVSPVLDELKMPTIAMHPAGSATPWLFTLNWPYDRGYAKSMAEFLDFLNKQKGFHIKSVAMVYTNYEAAQKVNEALKRRLPELGFTIAGEVPLDPKSTDLTAAMLRLRAMKPDATAGLVRIQEGALIDQARYALKIRGILFLGGTGGFSDPELWKDLGDTIGKDALCNDLFGYSLGSPDMKSAALHAMVEDMNAHSKLPFKVGMTGIVAAQGARVMQRVLEMAGTTQRDAVLHAYQTVNFPPGDPYLYLVRPEGISFAADRSPAAVGGIIIQWMPDRSQQIVWPPALATGEPRPLRQP